MNLTDVVLRLHLVDFRLPNDRYVLLSSIFQGLFGIHQRIFQLAHLDLCLEKRPVIKDGL